MKNIIISDDHPLFRQALREVIRSVFINANILEFESLQKTQSALSHASTSLLFLDLFMSDSYGLAGLVMIKGLYPELPVIIVSSAENPSTVRLAMQASASAYLFKSYSLSKIKEVVLRVYEGEIFLPSGIDKEVSLDEEQRLNNIALLSSLTPAQLRIYYLLVAGKMNKQIAYKFNISEATVKAHITSIYKKLGVRSRTQAVVIAKDMDIVLP